MSASPFDFDKKLARHCHLTRIIILVERLWAVVFIPLCILGLFIALSWFGLFRLLPSWSHYILPALFLVSFFYACKPIGYLKWPKSDEINARLEEDNRINHEGIAIHRQLISHPTEKIANALWKEHQNRMWRKLGDIKIGKLRSCIPDRDPYALRVLILLLVVTGFAYSSSSGAGHLTDAFIVKAPQLKNPPPLRIDGWVTPPAYTHKAAIFLTSEKLEKDNHKAISIPEKSEIIIRASGFIDEQIRQDPDISYLLADGTSVSFARKEIGIRDETDTRKDKNTPAQTSALSFKLTPKQDGKLSIAGHGSWYFSIVPDQAPQIEFSQKPSQARNGALELSYRVKDDYGIISADAEIIPYYPDDDHAFPLYGPPGFNLQLPWKNSEDGLARTNYDLTDHPLAGEKVTITLVAIDGAGQKTRSQSMEMVLPQKQFINPLAKSIIEQRQVLAFDAYKLPYVIELNDALTILPEETIPDIRDYLLIKTAREGLALAYREKDLVRWVDDLWSIALLLEDGDLSLAEQRLKDAQRALSQALENGASDKELARLMDNLRKAMDDYIRALAQKNNDKSWQENPQSNVENINTQDLRNMLDQIENMAQLGNREQARKMLQDLQNIMNNLQSGYGRGQQGGEQSALEQQINQLGKILHDQQRLMDQTFDLERQYLDQSSQELKGDNNQKQQESDEKPTRKSQQLRQEQQALQEQLQQLLETMTQDGFASTNGFKAADKAMGKAASELGKGETGVAGAGIEQGQALEALREGVQQILNELQQRMQAQGQQGGPANPFARRQRRNDSGFYGQDSNIKFGDTYNIQRAQEILKTIRERLGENFRLELEKKYLERLLRSND